MLDGRGDLLVSGQWSGTVWNWCVVNILLHDENMLPFLQKYFLHFLMFDVSGGGETVYIIAFRLDIV
jgi:hypothetical protein